MKILLTGGAGFIGSYVTQALLARGDEVAVVDNFNDYYAPALKRTRVKNFLTHPECRIYEQDIRDQKGLAEIFSKEKPDSVIHLAAMAGVRASLANPSLYQEVNVGGTLNILELAQKMEVKKLVYASSSSVYGRQAGESFAEQDPTCNPLSIYAATKKATELLAGVYRNIHGLNAVGLRYFTVYGPWGRPDMAYFDFAQKITQEKPITIYAKGNVSRDFTYIDDAVSGTLAVLDSATVAPIVNLGGEKSIPVSRLVALLEENLGKKAKIVWAELPPADAARTSANIELAKGLGWLPQVGFEEGVTRFCAWYRDWATTNPAC